jgi:site-specific DNA-cytosine methylase
MLVVATTLNSAGNSGGFRTEPGEHLIAAPLQASGHGVKEDESNRQTLVFDWQSGGDVRHNVSDRHTSALQASQTPAVAFTERTRPDGVSLEMQEELAYALTNPGAGSRTTSRNIAGAFGVRRLTPVECERLQGFPDNWTAYGADGPQSDSARYRQLGNAVAVPVAEWLGRRILAAEMETNQ